MSKYEGLRESIKMCNLSYNELARVTNVPRQFIQEYMRGAIDTHSSHSYKNEKIIDNYKSVLYDYFKSFISNQSSLNKKQKKMIGEHDLVVQKGSYRSGSVLCGVEYSPQINLCVRPVNVLIYDIEVSPLLGWSYNKYKTNLLKVEQEQVLLSFSVLTFNVDENSTILDGDISDIKCYTLADFNYSEEELVKILHRLFDEADVIVGFNSKGFDTKYANRYFIKYQLGRPSPFKQIDVFKEWKKLGKLSSNGLDSVNSYLFDEGKTDVKVGELWYDCIIKRDEDAYKLLKEYNNQDVALTYNLFKEILPYMSSSVNLSLLMQHPLACPRCGYIGSFEDIGYAYSQVGRYNQYQCSYCKSILQGRYQDSTIMQDDVYVDVRPILK